MTIFSLLQDINALGTLILAIIAVIAILVPIGTIRHQRPKFSIRLQAIKYEEEIEEEPELRISVINMGRYPAHACKILATIEDDKGKKLGSYYLPWIWEDPTKFGSSAGYPQGDPIKYTPYKEVTYVPIDIFPYESISTKFLFWLDIYFGSPENSILAVFGASHTYYYFPIWDKNKELITLPPLSEYTAYFSIPKEYGYGPYLESNITYSVKITVFSEEHTYLDLKKFFFKLGDKGISAGYTKECTDVSI
jgi:hypothetical protein